MFDRDVSGTVDFNEFSSLWKYIDEWKKCFRTFDRDGSGTIDRNELRHALHNFGYRISEETLQSVVRRLRRDNKSELTVLTVNSFPFSERECFGALCISLD